MASSAAPSNQVAAENTNPVNNNSWTSSPVGGTKRKHSVVEEEESNKWSERQSILNMSMTKLQPCPSSKTEASLRRSVLIFNTLKYLESQLQQDSLYSAQPNLALIPPKDLCLEPGLTDEIAPVASKEELPKPIEGKSDKPEAKAMETSTLALPTPPPAPAPITGQCQSSEQFLQDTTYILDSLLSSDKVSVNSFSPVIPFTSPSSPSPVQQTEMLWQEPDNMWFSKYDEPFTNWLLNDDVDHIMQVLVSGSAG